MKITDLKKIDWADAKGDKITKSVELFDRVVFANKGEYWELKEKETVQNCGSCEHFEKGECYRNKIILEREKEQCIFTCIKDYDLIALNKTEVVRLQLEEYEFFTLPED